MVEAAAQGFRRGVEIVRSGDARVVSLAATPPSERTALLSYSIAPFLGQVASPGMDPASSWVSSTIARILLARGWSVDVVSDRNTGFLPSKPYGVVVASRRSLARLVPRLPLDCLKVLFLDSADVLFQHAAECSRLLELKDRRRVVLAPTRYERVTPALDHADCALVQGNEFTLSTYGHARVPLHRVSAPAPHEHPSPADKNFERCRSGFLWLGGRGLVHQGLDRTLEAFVTLPDLRLTVSARLRDDPRFADAYDQELHHTPNIRLATPAGVDGEHVAALAGDCVAVVFPSCAEGQAAEVVACMAAGLIPIVTRESGVDVADFGTIVPDTSVEQVARAVRALARLPAAQLRDMAIAAWEFARVHHRPAVVARQYEEIFSEILRSRSA
jgi:glycosyltransferase involved in cell wall biosynthesis